jgi:PAS domain S-box-containing protein
VPALARGDKVTFGIRARLLAAFVAIALFTGVLGWYVVSTMGRMNEGQRTVYVDVFGGTHLLATWVDTSWQARADLLDYLLTDDPVANTEDRLEMVHLELRLNELVRLMDEADTDREDVGTLAALTAAWQSYTAWRDETVLAQVDRGDRAAALAAYRADGARMGALVDDTIDAFLIKKRQIGAALEASAAQSFDLTRGIASVLSVTAAGLGLVIGFFLSRSIARGVRQIATAAEGLAVGDLNQRITLDSKDEIGLMAGAVRDMIAYQQEMARVADAMASGDLTQNVQPKAVTDQLGNAFQRMIGNLRRLVGELEQAVRRANQLAELAEEREARMRAVLDSVADAIITFDAHGRIETVNPTAERIFGYAADDLIGSDVANLLGEDHNGALANGTRLELAGRRRDGTTFPMDLAVSEMRLADRRLSIASIRDITERKQADAAQRFLTEASTLLAASLDYQTTLASIARLAVPFLADGCVVEVVKDDEESPALTAVALVEPATVSLRGALGDLAEQVLSTGQSYLCSEGTDDIASDQLDRLREAGFTAAILEPLVVRGRPLGVISFVTARPGRQYGPKDVNLAQELAQRCALAIENARLYGEAQSAIGLRDDFFSVASHELKTPVAALMAYTQFLLKRAERQRGLSPAQMSEALEEVHWQSDRIARLVAQLLDTSRLDAGKLAVDPELTEVAALVQAAVHTVRANSQQHTITVNAQPETWAMVDPLRLEQVITNLVDNAIKYSPNGGPIDVDLLRPDAATMCLVVTDHGIGIPPEHRPHIFDRFYQAHAGQHFAGVAGMGLGLYISRRIVEMHAGSIQIDSPAGGGTRVTVTLPVGGTGRTARRVRVGMGRRLRQVAT